MATSLTKALWPLCAGFLAAFVCRQRATLTNLKQLARMKDAMAREPRAQPSQTWVAVQPLSTGAYRLMASREYRARFEVFGAASWVDSVGAVRRIARERGIPLASIEPLGADQYYVRSEPIPKTVLLERHPSIRVYLLERLTKVG